MCRRTQLCSKLWEAAPDHVKQEDSSQPAQAEPCRQCSFCCVLNKQFLPSHKQGENAFKRVEKGASAWESIATLYKWIPGTPLAAVWVNLISHFPCVDVQQVKATSTHHPHASPHFPDTKAQQILCQLCHFSRGQFFQCLVCVGSLHGFTTA